MVIEVDATVSTSQHCGHGLDARRLPGLLVRGLGDHDPAVAISDQGPGAHSSTAVTTFDRDAPRRSVRLADVTDSFGTGPRWTFSIDAVDAAAVGGIDVNLASEHAPAGEANISYWVHPDFRGRRIAADAVQLALCFLRDHTSVRRAHLMVEPANTASLAVVASTGATTEATTVDRHGRTLVRHSLEL